MHRIALAILSAQVLASCSGETGVPAPRTAPSPAADVKAARRTQSALPDRYQQHIDQLRETLPSDFLYEIEAPFVVIGNTSQEALQQHAQGTVRWAVENLKRDFFDADPDELLDIYLFEDAKSYTHYSTTLFDDPPDTPYGYYSPDDRALVMNISTGGGTLVHEIVHPFVEANFPQAPAWFNEGLGSLFEQSASRDGHIVGLTNWRLAGLQAHIKAGTLPSLRELTETSREAFYADLRADNYAQARYLLYYLQEQGLLRRYYRDFLAHRESDPTGYRTLLAILELEDTDMPAFELEWSKWALALRFPG